MKKKDKNGKKASGRQMKPIGKDCAGKCQYNIQEDVVDQKKVKEKDVFDKGSKKSNPPQKKKTRRPKNQKY